MILFWCLFIYSIYFFHTPKFKLVIVLFQMQEPGDGFLSIFTEIFELKFFKISGQPYWNFNFHNTGSLNYTPSLSLSLSLSYSPSSPTVFLYLFKILCLSLSFFNNPSYFSFWTTLFFFLLILYHPLFVLTLFLILSLFPLSSVFLYLSFSLRSTQNFNVFLP